MDEKDKKIARLEELLQSIKDNIDETESVLDSLSNSELQAENDNDLPDDEFDRLLDEFIQSQLSEEETEDEEESDNSPSNTSHHIIFKNTFFSICDTKEQIPRDSLRTQFSVNKGEYLFISTECIGQNESATIDAWDETFLAELIAPDGSSYIETQISMSIDTENYASPSAYFALPERENREGSWIYCLSRLSDKEEYTTKSATFISLPQKYDECFEVNNYLLFKNESIAPDPDRPIISYTSINPSIHSNYYIGFCGTSKLKDTDKSYEYEIKIRTQTGLTKYETVGTFISQDDEERNRLWTFQEPVDFSDYENGEYAVEVYFLGEKVLNAPFRIGNEEEGEYNLFNIQTRPPIGEKKEIDPTKEKDAMDSLQEMIGLNNLKQSIAEHLNYVKLLAARKRAGLKASIPPLHMVFTGNPGTGKTTVADFIGEIFHKMGLLEKGHVIRTDRSKLVGKWLGETEQKTEAAIEAAKGGVLFIDEAYSLFTNDKDGDKRDFGNRVIETLLPKLSDDNFGTIVILAGYPAEMKLLLESNPGLQSRFPFTFHFEDYSPEELLEIADLTIQREGYEITDSARQTLLELIKKDHRNRDRHFGNARYVNRLISSKILPAMATRLAQSGIYDSGNPDKRSLVTIEQEDIPDNTDEKIIISSEEFDERTIDECLARLDRMIGLSNVKAAIHNFVKIARLLHENGKNFFREIPLKWSFAGNTGTGKSTVAEIMSDLLKAMNILGNGQFIEIKGEQLYNVPDYKVDEVLQDAMKKSRQGLLFIDGDSPKFKNAYNTFDSEQLRIKLAGYTSALPGAHALIIAENRAPRQDLVEQLIGNGAHEVDHTLIFDDYTSEELFEILKQMLSDKDFSFEQKAESIMQHYIEYLCSDQYSCYANARTMKIISRTIMQNAYLRLGEAGIKFSRNRITHADVDCFEIDERQTLRNRIGFY